jgi:uncharacterized protein YkwD
MAGSRGILFLVVLALGLAAAPPAVLDAVPTQHDDRAQEQLREGIDGVADRAERAAAARGVDVGGTAPSVENRTAREARLERLIHERVNHRRDARGLENLTWNEDLATVARYHSNHMANESYFAHVSPSGESPGDRYDAFGVRCAGGENLGYVRYRGASFTDEELARRIVTGWMNSEGHRENLLRPRFEEEGIGVTVAERDGSLHVYATQNFC